MTDKAGFIVVCRVPSFYYGCKLKKLKENLFLMSQDVYGLADYIRGNLPFRYLEYFVVCDLQELDIFVEKNTANNGFGCNFSPRF